MSVASMTIQQANIETLEAITTNGGIVEAFPGSPATESCANDSDHGKGVCYGEDVEGLCLACMVDYIGATILAGELITVVVRS